jgi:hypothetical protein
VYVGPHVAECDHWGYLRAVRTRCICYNDIAMLVGSHQRPGAGSFELSGPHPLPRTGSSDGVVPKRPRRRGGRGGVARAAENHQRRVGI